MKTIIKLKPWGREIWFAWTNNYAGKIIELKKKHRFSLQYHEKKTETMYLFSGKLKVTYGTNPKRLMELLKNDEMRSVGLRKNRRRIDNTLRIFPKETQADRVFQKFLKSKILKPGDKIHIPPYTVHRALALEKSLIFEVSTPELDDVVKLADDYGRSGKGNNEKLDRTLAKKSIKNF